MKKLILFIPLLWACIAVAQQVKVVNSTDLQPINNCLIYNIDKSESVTTDNNGIADISMFKSTDKLIFTHVSFLTAEYDRSFFTEKVNTIVLTMSVINLQEVVLSANKVEEKYTDLPVRIDIIKAKQIQFANPQTTADLMQQKGTVFVQQSQLGGGSVVIRGMESNRVMMVIDGIRMNNAIYRSGHLQNIITIDPNTLSRVEVLHGPGSVIYGSDAMGGVMHFYTRSPMLSSTDKMFFSGNAMLRFASAANELSQNFNLNIGGKKLAAFIGASLKTIGDLREGSKRDSKYGDWGKCLYYAERIDGKDVMTDNSNPLIQKNTGYKQYDFFSKVLFKPSENYNLILNMQFSNSSNVPRYDRLSEMSEGKLKYAEWYYGPQTRALVSLKNEWTGATSLYDQAQLTAAFQYISEDRISRSFGKSKKKHQEETVQVYSLNFDLMKKIFSTSELRYGIEAIYNYVGSKAYNENVNTGEITYDAASRYPDGGDNMKNISAYASNNWEINKNLIFSQGLRLNFVSLYAKYTDEMMNLIKFPYSAEIEQNNTALNGSLGLVYQKENGLRISGNLSSGYRAPNIDDLTKLNESNSKDKLIVVPNPGLKPEYAYNAELTIGKTFSKLLQIDVTGFYTQLSNAFVLKPSLYNEQDSIMFDGELCAVQSMQNAQNATIYGIEGNLLIQITKAVSLQSTITYTHGRLKDEDEPLDHIPPIFGLTSLKVDLIKFTAEMYARYNGWKHIEDYSPSGEDNETYATVDGMPAWYTINLKAGYQINRYIGIQAGFENILDKHYRNFASGISAPGRNIYLTLRATF